MGRLVSTDLERKCVALGALAEGAVLRDYVTVVSGMPRSGTSLLMQMLAAGGMTILADDLRLPDVHNPRGYFEDQRARRIAKDATWVADARGKAVKIIYRLLPFLPAALEYRVILMERDMEEVFESQHDMLVAIGDAAAGQDRDKMLHAMTEDLDALPHWLNAQPNMRWLGVPYSGVVAAPTEWANRISVFLDGGLAEEAMAAVVAPTLYRHRK